MKFTSMVLANAEVSPGYRRMRLTAPSGFSARPGQFVMLRIGGGIDPLLRRPFGIFDVSTHTPGHAGAVAQPCFDILYRIVGKGTSMLATLHETDGMDILGPLGNGFDFGTAGEEKLIVGGGVGVAPLYLLAKELVKDSPVRLFAGGKSRDDILCITEFERLGVECYVATEDGSLGRCGLVTEALAKCLELQQGGTSIFACGPHAMLKAVASIAESYGVGCQVSLEGYMACGVGACLGCVTPGHAHTPETPDYRCVCSEGPVFRAEELGWGE